MQIPGPHSGESEVSGEALESVFLRKAPGDAGIVGGEPYFEKRCSPFSAALIAKEQQEGQRPRLRTRELPRR